MTAARLPDTLRLLRVLAAVAAAYAAGSGSL